MEMGILSLTENSLVLVDDKPFKLGSIIEFAIQFPEDALIESLPLKGKITKTEKADDTNKSKYLCEVTFQELTTADKLILTAYIQYLKREKVIDDLYTLPDLRSLLKNTEKCREEIKERLALIEFNYAKTKNIPFH